MVGVYLDTCSGFYLQQAIDIAKSTMVSVKTSRRGMPEINDILFFIDNL